VPHRLLRLLTGAALGLGLVALGGAAHADEPLDLAGRSVVDTTGKAGDLAPVTAAIQALQQRAGISLAVVYVANFDDTDADEDSAWADKAATASDLTGDKDILLAVAIDQRQFLVSASSRSGLSDRQLTQAEDSDLRPALEQDDWTGAAVAYALAVGDLATGTSTGSVAAAHPLGFDWAGAAPWLAPLGVLVVAAIIWLVISLRLRYLRRQQAR